MRALVFGRGGQLAVELARARWRPGARVLFLGRPDVDIRDRQSVGRAFDQARPDVAINVAAFTAVDRAESEVEMAFAVNRDGPRHIAEEGQRRGVPLVHVSTDFVFDGRRTSPWREIDPTGPLSVYARSKLEGERAIASSMEHYVIVRSSWLFAAHGANFVRTILKLAAERREIPVVDDQVGCPTPARDLAEVLASTAARLVQREASYGVYHYCGEGAVTWFAFAREIVETAGGDVATRPSLIPISTAQFGAKAARPAYSVLDCSKIARDYGFEQRSWRPGLKTVLDEIGA